MNLHLTTQHETRASAAYRLKCMITIKAKTTAVVAIIAAVKDHLIMLLRFSSFSSDINYIPGIEGKEGNNPNICKNKKMPSAKLAIQKAAVHRIHFFRSFLGKIPKA